MTGLFAVTDESPGRAGDTTSFNDYGKNVCLLPFCLSAACLIFSHVDLLVWADLESPVVDFFYFFFFTSLLHRSPFCLFLLLSYWFIAHDATTSFMDADGMFTRLGIGQKRFTLG